MIDWAGSMKEAKQNKKKQPMKRKRYFLRFLLCQSGKNKKGNNIT